MVKNDIENQDLAGKETWDIFWQADEVPSMVDPRNRNYNNTVNLRMHDYFKQVFANLDTNTMSLMEVGAARSTWLPYFSKEFGFKVTGLDYSELGCKQTEYIFEQAQVEGEMILADMFDPPEHLLNSFDVAFTIGVIEHFTETVEAVNAIAKFVKPGGLIITQIPNMAGSVGWLQSIIDRKIFDMHIVIDQKQLKSLHEATGLEVLSCDYFIFTHYGVADMHKVDPNGPNYKSKRFFHVQMQRLSKVFWLLENKLGRFPANRITSPYIMCTARKPK